jgi:hypothetical protein
MASEEQLDATCRRLQTTRLEIFEMAHVLKGDRQRPADPNTFPRSRIMRALTGQPGRTVLKNAALALAMSGPKSAWQLAKLTPLFRPLIVRYLADRIFRPRRPTTPAVTN